MAILANGVELAQERYEFGVRFPNKGIRGDLALHQAEYIAGLTKGAEIVMRIVYVTPWQETDIEH